MAPGLIGLLAGIAVLSLAGCGNCRTGTRRTFQHAEDVFAFANELKWRYSFAEPGRVVTHRTEPPPDFSLRCFTVSRLAREFFYHARFDAAQPRATPAEYQKLIQAVRSRDSRCPSPESEKIVIPGYANLNEFSAAHPDFLKVAAGAAWHSYVQRGNWRMIFPFGRRHQSQTAAALAEKITRGFLPIVHLVDFPTLKMNHAILLTGVTETPTGLSFRAYDPNNPGQAVALSFDTATRRFHFDRNSYYRGGPVNVYEVYKNAFY